MAKAKRVQKKIQKPKIKELEVEESKIEISSGQDQQLVIAATHQKKTYVLRIPLNASYADAYLCTREILLTIKKAHEQQQKQLAAQEKANQQMNTKDVPETAEG